MKAARCSEHEDMRSARSYCQAVVDDGNVMELRKTIARFCLKGTILSSNSLPYS